MVKLCEWGDNIKFASMVKMLQDLPKTNTFGKGNYGTFDAILFLNVMHLLSAHDKQEQLNCAYSLLKPVGLVLFLHIQFNSDLTENLPDEPFPLGGYQQIVSFIRLENEMPSERFLEKGSNR